MKASSSLLEAFVGGVFAFSDPSPRIASQEPAKVAPNVAMASCERSLDDIGDFEVIGEGSYIVGTNRPAEDIVHGHHLIEWLSQRGVQAGSLVLLDAA
jgi:hypothetical protein